VVLLGKSIHKKSAFLDIQEEEEEEEEWAKRSPEETETETETQNLRSNRSM
jgi:hypothetical protein